MARPSKITQMTPEDRDALDRELIDRGFSDYDGLQDWLEGRGYRIGRSTIHRHGKRLERRIDAIKASTQAALMIADAAPDDEDARSSAVLSMIQSDLFDGLLALQEAADAEDPAERLKTLSQAAKAIADVSRASVGVKRHAAEVRNRTKAAAEKVEGIATGAGVDPDTLRQIREEIYGIVE